MSRRKEVFQSKVLRKLYTAAPEVEKEPRTWRNPPQVEEDRASKVSQDGGASKTRSAVKPGGRMYTVLPPPADYRTDPEKCITLPELKTTSGDEDPAEESVHDSDEEQDEEEEGQQKRKRRRRKRKTASGKDGAAPVSESSTGQSPTPVDEEPERISKNKKRKLKKKRHKEKLLSLGLLPRATALEFTYRRDDEEEEERRRAAEVSDFLKETMKSYMSVSSLHADELRLLSGTVDELLSSIASGCKPASVLNRLHSLKASVQQKQTDHVESALKEFSDASSLSAEETTAVVSLFQYWITDILPMQTQLPTMQSH